MVSLNGCFGHSSATTTSTPTPAPTPAPTTSDGKADALLAQMTQAEKLQMVQGRATFDDTGKFIVPRGAGGWMPGIPRLGIPDLYYADGSAGASVTNGPATALPSSLASAANWDLAEAYKYGTVIQSASVGMDEASLALRDLVDTTPFNQDALVSAVAAANPHTIVVIESGGPVLMPWLGQVSALLEVWYPGQNGGPGIANLLFGGVNPSGKLPITFPGSDDQLPRPAIPQPPDSSTPFAVNYSEGYNVGYKWFDANGLTPLFPFGFGLSDTTFSIASPALTNNLSSTTKPNFQVTFTLANAGAVAGAEVAQVHLGLPPSLNEPPKRLVGWQKVNLDPDTSQSVTIEVDQKDSSHPMSYWETAAGSWEVASGQYTVCLGNSSAHSSLVTVGTIKIP